MKLPVLPIVLCALALSASTGWALSFSYAPPGSPARFKDSDKALDLKSASLMETYIRNNARFGPMGGSPRSAGGQGGAAQFGNALSGSPPNVEIALPTPSPK